MDMNATIGTNALDTPGVVGKPLDRVDGPARSRAAPTTLMNSCRTTR
ncbi:MAG: hypothetical protein WDN69_09895 [Aliidongia sp.]